MQTSVAPRSQASAARRRISACGTSYDAPLAEAAPFEKAQKAHAYAHRFV